MDDRAAVAGRTSRGCSPAPPPRSAGSTATRTPFEVGQPARTSRCTTRPRTSVFGVEHLHGRSVELAVPRSRAARPGRRDDPRRRADGARRRAARRRGGGPWISSRSPLAHRRRRWSSSSCCSRAAGARRQRAPGRPRRARDARRPTSARATFSRRPALRRHHPRRRPARPAHVARPRLPRARRSSRPRHPASCSTSPAAARSSSRGRDPRRRPRHLDDRPRRRADGLIFVRWVLGTTEIDSYLRSDRPRPPRRRALHPRP